MSDANTTNAPDPKPLTADDVRDAVRVVNANVTLAALAHMEEVAADRHQMQPVKLSILRRRIVALQRQIENQAIEVRPHGTVTAEPIAWAVYGGRTGVLRYVLQDEERASELVESGYVARPLFEHPAPTPPADDVREALFDVIDQHLPMQATTYCSCGATWSAPHLVAALVGDRREFGVFDTPAFEVRPRGTVTDAEVLRAKAAALTEFADAVRMPFTVFRGDNEEPITPGDLMRETAARYLAEAAREVHP